MWLPLGLFLGQAVKRCFWELREEIQSWKPGQHCLRGIPFPERKAGTGEGPWPILYDREQEGDLFTSRKVWWSLSCFLSPASMDKCGCEVITGRISGGKLSNEAFPRILGALYSSDFLLYHLDRHFWDTGGPSPSRRGSPGSQQGNYGGNRVSLSSLGAGEWGGGLFFGNRCGLNIPLYFKVVPFV